MAYPHKWSPISYKSSAGQRKHIDQRPMLYRWTTPPTSCMMLRKDENYYWVKTYGLWSGGCKTYRQIRKKTGTEVVKKTLSDSTTYSRGSMLKWNYFKEF